MELYLERNLNRAPTLAGSASVLLWGSCDEQKICHGCPQFSSEFTCSALRDCWWESSSQHLQILRFRSYPHVCGQCNITSSLRSLAVSDTRKQVFGSLIPHLWGNSFQGEGFQKTLLLFTGNQDFFDLSFFVRHHLLYETIVYATLSPKAAVDK